MQKITNKAHKLKTMRPPCDVFLASFGNGLYKRMPAAEKTFCFLLFPMIIKRKVVSSRSSIKQLRPRVSILSAQQETQSY